MIRITALYRNEEGARFDFDYYLNTHMVMAEQLLGDFGLLRWESEKCVRKLDGSDPDYVCITRLDFSGLEELERGLERHTEELRADFANYTNIEPELQVSEIVGRG